MPAWVVATGESLGAFQVAGATAYACLIGSYLATGVEAPLRYKMRDSYILSKLFVRVVTNNLTGITTVRSRKNSGNGNQSVSIGAGVTGTFEDNANSDSLVSGDYINSQSVAGAGTSIRISVIAYKLESTGSVPPLGSCRPMGESVNFGLTRYSRIEGRPDVGTIEWYHHYIFRVSATLSYFRVYVNSNTLNGASTFRTRVNDANGNQSVSIPATATGEFEDVGASDNISVGNTVNFQMVAGGAAGTIKFSLAQLKSTSTGRQTGLSKFTNGFGTTVYTLIEGYEGDAIESRSQLLVRTPFLAKNFYVNVYLNTADGASTLKTRKSGVDGNLSVSVGATTTGEFEDITNSDAFTVTDYANFKIVTGGTAGLIYIGVIGFEQQQLSPASGSIAIRLLEAGVLG